MFFYRTAKLIEQSGIQPRLWSKQQKMNSLAADQFRRCLGLAISTPKHVIFRLVHEMLPIRRKITLQSNLKKNNPKAATKIEKYLLAANGYSAVFNKFHTTLNSFIQDII